MASLANFHDGLELQLAGGELARRAEYYPSASRNPVSIAVELLIMATRGEDRRIARRIAGT